MQFPHILSLCVAALALSAPISLAAQSSDIHPFTINVPQSTLDDVQQRLKLARYPAFQLVDDWSYGVKTDVLKDLVQYWQHGYDWRKREKWMNTFHHYKTEVDGLNIHFIHHKSKEPNAIPVLMTHGWPGTYLECVKILPMLVEKQSNSSLTFDLVCPSLPGYIFSDPPKKPGTSPDAIATLFRKLMQDKLGYKEYVVQGGDFGAVVSMHAAMQDTEENVNAIKALHTSFTMVTPPFRKGILGFFDALVTSMKPYWFLPARQAQKQSESLSVLWTDGGYLHEQATRPDTIGTALEQSPVSVLAWMVEKIYHWSDSRTPAQRATGVYSSHEWNGDLYAEWTKDEIIDFVMLYWSTNSVTTAIRLYYESFNTPTATAALSAMSTVDVKQPSAVVHLPAEITQVPERWLKYYFNLKQFTEYDHGGHFATHGTPELMNNDFRRFIQNHVVSEFSGHASHSGKQKEL